MKKSGRFLSSIGMAIAAFGICGLFSSQASAELKMTGGTTVCNGTFFRRGAVDEVHMGTWNFTNYNDDVTIKVRRVRVYTADGGQPVIDYPTAPDIPPPGTKVELAPHQSTQLKIHDVFGYPDGILKYLPPEKRPVQLIVDWYVVGGRGYALDGEAISEVRVGGGGYLGGVVTARNSVKCRLIRSEWR
ncbi:MAG: hypothetical protein ACWGOV_07115 [Acidiferrobacterales bacterium]